MPRLQKMCPVWLVGADVGMPENRHAHKRIRIRLCRYKTPEEMMFFVDRSQFLLIPAIGFVRDNGDYCLTIAFLYYGISFRLFSIN